MSEVHLIRARLGLTQEQLAAQLGLTQPSISRLENGQPLDRRTELALRALEQERVGEVIVAEHVGGDTAVNPARSPGKTRRRSRCADAGREAAR